MQSQVFYLFVALALLAASSLLVVWGERLWKNSPPAKDTERKGEAFRSFYHVIWVLLFWYGLIFSLPFWISYKQKIINAAIFQDRFVLVAKALIFPIVLFVLLLYGRKRGYLKWIHDLNWPDKENL
jgi:hypothetical protein